MKYFLGFIIFFMILTMTSCGRIVPNVKLDNILPKVYRCTFHYYDGGSRWLDFRGDSYEEVDLIVAPISQSTGALSYDCYLLIS